MHRHRRFLVALVAVATVLGAGCGDGAERSSSGRVGDRPATSGTRDTGTARDLEGAITVSAAASLADAFTRIGADFMAEHPDVEVTFNLDSSSILTTQILEGAPADVFASADETNLATLTDEGRIAGDPVVFARNELVIVTKPGNTEGITGLADLAAAGVIALCGEDAPCGRYADQVLAEAGVSIPDGQVTRGQNATATLTAVTQGDAVAGIVYASDAVRAGDAAEAVTIPADQNVIVGYPIGVVASTGDPLVAEAFLAQVLSADGQRVLAELGFRPAP